MVSPLRAEAIKAVGEHYAALFGDDPAAGQAAQGLRDPGEHDQDPQRQRLLNGFFFWAAWACATDRPGGEITYTNNWPSEALIDNRPTGSIVVWSVVSFVVLLAGIGALAWYFAIQHGKRDESHELPKRIRCWPCGRRPRCGRR